MKMRHSAGTKCFDFAETRPLGHSENRMLFPQLLASGLLCIATLPHVNSGFIDTFIFQLLLLLSQRIRTGIATALLASLGLGASIDYNIAPHCPHGLRIPELR